MSEWRGSMSVRIPAGDVELEAMLHRPSGAEPLAGVVVCHPHPRYGGDMHNTVVLAVCRALVERGMAALRFNFRGVGGSTGVFDGGRGEAHDAAAAFAFLAEQDGMDRGRTGIAGYSFGALAALAADVEAGAVGLVSPPLQGLDRERLAGMTAPLLMVTGDSDHVCPEAAFHQLALTLAGAVEAEVVPGADHFWAGHERDLDALIGPFFARTLTERGL